MLAVVVEGWLALAPSNPMTLTKRTAAVGATVVTSPPAEAAEATRKNRAAEGALSMTVQNLFR